MGRPVIPDPIVEQVSTPEPEPRHERPSRRRAPILHMALPLTGNYSVILAYRKIISAKVYHGIGWLQSDLSRIVTYKHQARNMNLATSQCLIGGNGDDHHPAPGLTFEEWEEWLGRWDVLADLASFFAPHLIEVYKHSKVIILERNIDEWIRDMDQTLIKPLFSTSGYIFARFIEPLAGSRNHWAMRRLLIAFFQADTRKEILANMRGVYERHYSAIRAKVPRERLLEFKVEQGWGPLCAFLGEPIPDSPFPKESEMNTFQGFLEESYQRKKKIILIRVGLAALLCIAVALGVWAYLKYT